MSNVIKRNNLLSDLLKNWNHNDPSNIGIGRLSRKQNNNGTYTINKSYGRTDIALFNIETSLTINGEIVKVNNEVQLCLEPSGISYRNESELVKNYIRNWIARNKKEICIQLHFLDWFEKTEIRNATLQETIGILESYEYNQEEAEELFSALIY